MINRQSLGTKITFAFALLLLVILGLGATTMNRLAAMHVRDQEVSANWLPSVAALGNLLTALEECRVYEARLAIATDTTRPVAIDDLGQKVDVVDRLRAAYEPLIARGTQEESLLKSFDDLWPTHRAAVRGILGAPAQARSLFDDAHKQVFLDSTAALRADLAFTESSGERAAADATATYVATRTIIMIVLATGVIAAFGLCSLIFTTMSRPLTRPDAHHAPPGRWRCDSLDRGGGAWR